MVQPRTVVTDNDCLIVIYLNGKRRLIASQINTNAPVDRLALKLDQPRIVIDFGQKPSKSTRCNVS